MKLSIVTTLYKSSLYVEEFYERITKEAKKITDNYEIIFVDDGSPAITTKEAKKRVTDAVNRYRTEPERFTELNDNFWNDTEKRLLQRH